MPRRAPIQYGQSSFTHYTYLTSCGTRHHGRNVPEHKLPIQAKGQALAKPSFHSTIARYFYPNADFLVYGNG